MPTLTDHFTRRARLYRVWDREFNAQTRFFGAAARVNGLFALLCRLHVLKDASAALLNSLGACLEDANRTVVLRLRGSLPDLSSRALDKALVQWEQYAAERHLRDLRRQNLAGYTLVCRDIDTLLNHGL